MEEDLRLTVGPGAEPQSTLSRCQWQTPNPLPTGQAWWGLLVLHLLWGYKEGSPMPKLDGKTQARSCPSGGRGLPGLLCLNDALSLVSTQPRAHPCLDSGADLLVVRGGRGSSRSACCCSNKPVL